MIDLFKLLQIETKEDKYTFCLFSFFEHSEEFRVRAGKVFGFEDGNFERYRGEIGGIVPDIVLFNDKRIAVIESKMFSSEGYNQTKKYAEAKEKIKGTLKKPDASVVFYYLTLAGNEAGCNEFISIPWAEFYKEVLRDITFDDRCLDLLKDTFLMQANKYDAFQKDWQTRNYQDLFNAETYWITPYSLLSAGNLDGEWRSAGSEKKFSIYNGRLNGKGHSEFRTDLKRAAWHKEGEQPHDNIHLFIRIEWEESAVNVCLNWENYDEKEHISGDNIVFDYVPTKKLPEEVKNNVKRNKSAFLNSWEKPTEGKSKGVNRTNYRPSMLRMLKCPLDCNERKIETVIHEIKDVIAYYEQEIERILGSLKIENGHWQYAKNN